KMMRRSAADVALVELWVLQERHERPWRPAGVAEPEVTRVGVVVVGALPDEGEAEHVAVERGRAFEVGADQRDVVQPGERHPAWRRTGQALTPKPPDRRMKARRRNGKQATATTTAMISTASLGTPTATASAPARNPASPASSVVCER